MASKNRIALGLALWMGVVGAAAGQTATDSVTVHASKKSLDRQVQEFVGSADVETRTGQLPRWHEKICPKTLGLPADFNDFVSGRIVELAAQVKAPAGDLKTCHVNLLIIFTKEPQPVLDMVRAKKPEVLGSHYNEGEAKTLATVKYPVQAWYATATEDVYGRITPDDPAGDWIGTSDPDEILANATHVLGSRLSIGLESQFSSVLVVADLTKMGGRPIGAMADYIAVLALTQSKGLDGCKDLQTITNLFSPNCPQAAAASEATPADIAYLHALYSTDPALLAGVQQGSIQFEMARALKGK